MNKKLKRTLIGCVLPLLATALACGIVFYQNAGAVVFGLLSEEPEPVAEGTITLTMGNWEEYFEYVEEYTYEKNDKGEVEKVKLDVYYKMKDEYYEKLKSSSEQVIVMLDVEDTFKEYKITDPVTGEWELTGKNSKYESKFYEFYVTSLGNDRDMCFWDAETNKCEIYGELFYQEIQNEMLIQVIDEIEVRAASGEISFE